MDSKKSNKIREIVRLQQILKKWKKLANASSSKNNNNANYYNKITNSTSSSCDSSSTATSSTTNSSGGGGGGGSKSIKFLKKTLSFTESSISSSSSSNVVDVVVPKGYLAVCVGKELKRFVIPMEYLGHQAFGILLREAEEEFGFQQEGVLKIPCEVAVFEKILKMMEHKTDDHEFFLHELGFGASDQTDMSMGCYSSPDNCELTPSRRHAQMCR